jgi:malonate transporter MadL subunit
MVIFGTALLAACYLAGVLLGDALGHLIGVKANVGGVGIAMMLLIVAQTFLRTRGLLKADTDLGVRFWAAMYIPVVVAMAATQNVVVAVRSGPIALLAAIGSFGLCACAVAVINRTVVRRVRERAEAAAAAASPQIHST